MKIEGEFSESPKNLGIKISICIQTLKYAMVLCYLDGILRVQLAV